MKLKQGGLVELRATTVWPTTYPKADFFQAEIYLQLIFLDSFSLICLFLILITNLNIQLLYKLKLLEMALHVTFVPQIFVMVTDNIKDRFGKLIGMNCLLQQEMALDIGQWYHMFWKLHTAGPTNGVTHCATILLMFLQSKSSTARSQDHSTLP